MTTFQYDILCRLAAAYDDAPTAKALFDGLQNTHYRRFWEGEGSYKAAKAWANKPQSMPEKSNSQVDKK